MTCRMKSENACMSASGICESRPTRPGKGDAEVPERDVRVEDGAGAGAAPVQHVNGTPAGALRVAVRFTRSPRQCIAPWLTMPRKVCVVIGPFIGWKWVGSRRRPRRLRERLELDGQRVRSPDVVGVAEVPRQAVEVAEDVAARARGFAVAGGEVGVVQERPAVDDAGGLGVVQRRVVDLGLAWWCR